VLTQDDTEVGSVTLGVPAITAVPYSPTNQSVSSQADSAVVVLAPQTPMLDLTLAATTTSLAKQGWC